MILSRAGAYERSATGLLASLNDGFYLRIDALREGWLRIAVLPSEGPEIDRTWLVTPHDDVPLEGRDRMSLEGFDAPKPNFLLDGFESGSMRVRLSSDGKPLALRVDQQIEDTWVPALVDRPAHAWRWSPSRSAVTHYSLLGERVRHYGLGDAGGPVDRTGRRIRCLQTDALGYDAGRSDPLYKHAPFVACANGGQAFGLLYDTMSECTFDLGAEHSNYFERYRHVELQEQGCVLHVFAGPRLSDVVKRLYGATGRRAFPPRWAFGFAFTSMHHADAENAQGVIEGFAQEARAKDLPISAIHFGSGYTADANGLRAVFNWNEQRFPDRGAMFAKLKRLGFRTVANVKPVLLTTHFAYDRAVVEGWFVRRADGSPAVEAFWGGQGASLDLTCEAAANWWRQGVTEQVLAQGFDAVWNDNNEGELWDETATVSGFGRPMQGMAARPLQALAMTRASFEATRDFRSDERPHTISRAGPIGIARYGETWSGDNATSWHTLRWNLRQGLSMSLSGMPLVGHDIGGFVGPPPEPELLVRWFQMMALHPRCVMNSWKADHGNVPNLPWMHEDAFDHVREALRLRYRFLPTLYSLVWEGGPVIVPLDYHFDEPAASFDADAFMLGADILVLPVMREGAQDVEAYLPGPGVEWVSWDGVLYHGGQRAVLPAPLDTLPMLFRTGSVAAVAKDWDATRPHDATHVELTGFLGKGLGETEGRILMDDGLSPTPRMEDVVRWRFVRDADGAGLSFEGSPVERVTASIRYPQ